MKLNPIIFDMEKQPMISIDYITSSVIRSKINSEEDILINYLRESASPKIKGEITYGKIKWRGISFHQQIDGFNRITWIEQRGKVISPKVVINLLLNIEK
jgi:hypothetical protein